MRYCSLQHESNTNMVAEHGNELPFLSGSEQAVAPEMMHKTPAPEKLEKTAESAIDPIQGSNEDEINLADEVMSFANFEEAFAYHEAEAESRRGLEEQTSD